MSDDRRYGITLIAFLGSVFSPFYAWSRRHGLGDPMRHCCMHAALYGVRRRWAMSERPAARVARDTQRLQIGGSTVRWDGMTLAFSLDERSMPLPRRVRGQVRVHPASLTGHTEALGSGGRHFWSPVAPLARIEVELTEPRQRWSGHGYLDSNWGSEPLEQGFRTWNWCRTASSDRAAILYDTVGRDGMVRELSLSVGRDGSVERFAPPIRVRLPRTRWGVGRESRAEGCVRVVRTLTDAPFYSRSLLTTRLLGEERLAVHESLDLDRFTRPWVQMMLPFRVRPAFF